MSELFSPVSTVHPDPSLTIYHLPVNSVGAIVNYLKDNECTGVALYEMLNKASKLFLEDCNCRNSEATGHQEECQSPDFSLSQAQVSNQTFIKYRRNRLICWMWNCPSSWQQQWKNHWKSQRGGTSECIFFWPVACGQAQDYHFITSMWTIISHNSTDFQEQNKTLGFCMSIVKLSNPC